MHELLAYQIMPQQSLVMSEQNPQPRQVPCSPMGAELQGNKFGDHLISSSTNSSEGLEEVI